MTRWMAWPCPGGWPIGRAGLLATGGRGPGLAPPDDVVGAWAGGRAAAGAGLGGRITAGLGRVHFASPGQPNVRGSALAGAAGGADRLEKVVACGPEVEWEIGFGAAVVEAAAEAGEQLGEDGFGRC